MRKDETSQPDSDLVARLQHDLADARRQSAEYAARLERTTAELRTAQERLNELDRSQNALLLTLSHELRHPLAIAKGYLELVTMGPVTIDDETRHYLEIAEHSLKELAKLLDDLLDLTRLEAGRYAVELHPESLFELVSRTIQTMSAAAVAKEISLGTCLPDSISLVMADSVRITQVLTNLVDNALKFTSAGGWITISAEEKADLYEIAVSDNGIGIPSLELDQIFEPFYQIKNPELPATGGAGLGLAICREIIRLHGGQIWATSELGQGSQFHFTLKRADPDSE